MSGWLQVRDELYDPATGKRVGYVDINGREQPFDTNAIQAAVSGAGVSAAFQPYQIAPFGDSRSDLGSASPDLSTYQLVTDIRAVTWAVAQLQDCELTRNYGVSGDAAVNWNLASRSGGKTFADLDQSSVDLVVIQYGINDAMGGASAATITAALQALCMQIIKSGKRFVFDSIIPVRAPATNPVTTQATADAVNAAMSAWIGGLPSTMARYADTASVLKAPDGFASTAYFDSGGIHLTAAGARAARAVLSAAIRALLPVKPGLLSVPDATAANMLNQLPPNGFYLVEAGTGAAVMTYGQDSQGYYVDWVVTPATFASGEFRIRVDLSANFQTASPPYYALAGNEMLQGTARVILDNGAGGTPNCYALGARQRFYTGSVFRDWGRIPGGTPDSTLPDFTGGAVDIRLTTPRMANATASAVANPAAGSGYQLQVFVSAQNLTPFRIRLYNPQLRRVAWNPALLAITPPASGSAYTNATPARQQVIVSGGTVSAIAINGTATGLTSGVFTLAPGDTLTPTYSVVPTMASKTGA